MAQDLSALYNLLDHQIKQGESERVLTEFVCTLERKYEKKQTFICSLECNNHVGIKEDELGNALIPEYLPSAAAEKMCKAVQTRPDGICLFNAASLTLVGNESYATLLRLMACII